MRARLLLCEHSCSQRYTNVTSKPARGRSSGLVVHHPGVTSPRVARPARGVPGRRIGRCAGPNPAVRLADLDGQPGLLPMQPRAVLTRVVTAEQQLTTTGSQGGPQHGGGTAPVAAIEPGERRRRGDRVIGTSLLFSREAKAGQPIPSAARPAGVSRRSVVPDVTINPAPASREPANWSAQQRPSIRSAMPCHPASTQRPAATARRTARSRWLSAESDVVSCVHLLPSRSGPIRRVTHAGQTGWPVVSHRRVAAGFGRDAVAGSQRVVGRRAAAVPARPGPRWPRRRPAGR